jgi:hypothetical protein
MQTNDLRIKKIEAEVFLWPISQTKLELREINVVSKHEACHPKHRLVHGREDIPRITGQAVKLLGPITQDEDVLG